MVFGPSPSVATVAKAVTLQITPEQAQKVVLVGNIGEFSLVLRQPGEDRSLQTRRMTDDDLGAAFLPAGGHSSVLSGAGADFVPKISARQENAKLTIYHGTIVSSAT